jgi:hypothetical protein
MNQGAKAYTVQRTKLYVPVGIKVVAVDSARLTTLGGSEVLVENGEALVGLTVANSLVLLVPTPD